MPLNTRAAWPGLTTLLEDLPLGTILFRAIRERIFPEVSGNALELPVSNVLAGLKYRIVVFATHDRELASSVDEVISVYPSVQTTHTVAAPSNA